MHVQILTPPCPTGKEPNSFDQAYHDSLVELGLFTQAKVYEEAHSAVATDIAEIVHPISHEQFLQLKGKTGVAMVDPPLYIHIPPQAIWLGSRVKQLGMQLYYIRTQRKIKGPKEWIMVGMFGGSWHFIARWSAEPLAQVWDPPQSPQDAPPEVAAAPEDAAQHNHPSWRSFRELIRRS